KRKSPSKGDINKHADVVEVTGAYTKNGASALSVLTDTQFFGGNANDLIAARVNQIPIIRKDFIVDEYQIVEARAMGADAILLIAACLSPLEVKQLAEFASLLGLEVLLELHGEEELEHICDKIDLVGINNRNLKTFEVDIARSLAMAAKIPDTRVKIAESGISNVENIKLFKDHGFSGFLIGENFMKQENPGNAFEQFVKLLRHN
ncbi:MAG: indole-3-glycerol-phosphate synthase, partial [Flavitalea sp.]